VTVTLTSPATFSNNYYAVTCTYGGAPSGTTSVLEVTVNSGSSFTINAYEAGTTTLNTSDNNFVSWIAVGLYNISF